MKEEIVKEVRGTTFQIFVEESRNKRKISVIDKEAADEKGHSYLVKRDVKRSVEPSLFKDGESLPPRQEHILDVFNEATSLYFQKQDEKEELRKDIEEIVEAGATFIPKKSRYLFYLVVRRYW